MLPTSTDLLTFLREQARVKSISMEKENFIITFLAKIEAQFRPLRYDMPYGDIIVLAQTIGSGCCFCYAEDPLIPDSILGEDSRYVQTQNRSVDIAILDAAYSNLIPEPDILCRLEGNSIQKAKARSALILGEVQRIIKNSGISRPCITMVGAVGNILTDLDSLSTELFATDMDPTLIGKKLGGVEVEDGLTMTLKRIQMSNVGLITGMTLATETLCDILNIANANGVKIIMYSETGANFASEYLNWGVESVVSELYPFYMFPGSTILRVYRSTSLPN